MDRVKQDGTHGLALKFKELQQQIDAIRSARVGAIPHGTGSPEGERYGSPGHLYIDDDGEPGAILWLKEEGDNTPEGWRAL